MRRGRRWWTILVVAPLVLLAADTLYWWFAARDLARGFAAWEAYAQGTGWSARHAAPVRGGWPFSATLELPGISLARATSNAQEQMSWSANRLLLRVDLALPTQLAVSVEGQQRLQLPGAEVPFTAERFRLELPLPAGVWPESVALAAENLHATIPNGGAAAVRSLHARADTVPGAQPGESALSLALEAEDLQLPGGMSRPLGPRLAKLEAEGLLNGPVPTGHTPAEQATAWRDGGGSLEIRRLAVNWGPLDLTGTATLALDDQLQPMGAGSARLVGYAETMDGLAAHGVISRSAATATKAVLSLLAHAPDDGGPPDVEVPLTLQYRTLSMRQVPLLRLPELDWP